MSDLGTNVAQIVEDLQSRNAPEAVITATVNAYLAQLGAPQAKARTAKPKKTTTRAFTLTENTGEAKAYGDVSLCWRFTVTVDGQEPVTQPPVPRMGLKYEEIPAVVKALVKVYKAHQSTIKS